MNLIECLSSQISVPVDDLRVSLEDRPLDLESPLKTIKVTDIITAFKECRDKVIELKIQDGHSREPKVFSVSESSTIGELLARYTETSEGTLMLDGEKLSKETHLRDIDLEGGECLDYVLPRIQIIEDSPTCPLKTKSSSYYKKTIHKKKMTNYIYS
ncbi:Putative LOC101895653 [Caligus rogercresseyi]|uniref:LOC101895653 n=1 Tax=Caligus rogercresseyi TaxID=217165 RepID=A0A7T8KEB4_CALRO|nr:Putative LOC101895653 [Caligus rogercresseyi]